MATRLSTEAAVRKEAGKSKDIFLIISGRDFRLKIFFEGILVGISVGVVISAFRFLLEKAEELRAISYTVAKDAGAAGGIARLAALILLAGIVSFIIKNAPQTAGSGIVQVKGFLLGQVKMKWLRNLIGKFFGAIICIGAGLSLGRQGPAVQMGASIGQGLSRLLGRLRMEEKYLVTSGAGAGLAAAFNAPLAGVVFALEEIHKSFSPAALISAMGAAISADFVMRQFFGAKPVMDFSGIPVLPQQYYLSLIGLGLFCGLIGILFNRLLLWSFHQYKRLNGAFPLIPSSWLPLGAFLLAGALGYALPQVLGGGESLITSLVDLNYALLFLFLLLAVKFAFTMVCAASGAPGGIFLPMLVIGALAGNIYGKIMVSLYPGGAEFIPDFVVFAMAALFTAVVKAPVTGSILITEMTGSFEHLLPVIIVSMVSYIISDVFKTRSVYEDLYQLTVTSQNTADRIEPNQTDIIHAESRNLVKADRDAEEINAAGRTEKAPAKSRAKTIIEEVVCSGSQLEGKRVETIRWPERCLIVNIRRGEEEIIPRGGTRIWAGDFLYLLVDQGKESEMKAYLASLCKENHETKT